MLMNTSTISSSLGKTQYIKVHKKIANCFDYKDLVHAEWILGIKINCSVNNSKIILSQKALVNKILSQAEMMDAGTKSAPFSTGIRLETDKKKENQSKPLIAALLVLFYIWRWAHVLTSPPISAYLADTMIILAMHIGTSWNMSRDTWKVLSTMALCTSIPIQKSSQ